LTRLQFSGGIRVTTTENIDGIRKYDKRSYCYFCHLPQTKLSRHLLGIHKQEDQVIEYDQEKDEKKKQILYLKLHNLGNHVHNQQVVHDGQGEFIVLHRPKYETDYTDYVHCRYCYAYLSKRSIWKHACVLAPKTVDGKKVPNLRKAGVAVAGDVSNATENIGFAGLMNGFRQDDVGKIAMTDPLILALSKQLLMKFGGDREQFNYVRGKMRQLALLLQCLRRSAEQDKFVCLLLNGTSALFRPLVPRIVEIEHTNCAND